MTLSLAMDEFRPGSIWEAEPLSLVLPRSEYDHPTLICGESAEPIAVFLSGRDAYRAFPVGGPTDAGGVIIHSLRVKVDLDSAFDPGHLAATPGSVIRRGQCLLLSTRREMGSRVNTALLQGGLPASGPFEAGFLRWRLVLGEGVTERTVRDFVALPNDPR